MWEVLLHMYYFYWLMNKDDLAYGREKYNQVGRDREKESRQSQGVTM